MKREFRRTQIAETVLGFVMYAIPVICLLFILVWAGRAYAEGYGLFVQKALDTPGEAHSEMVTITEEDAGSAMAVGKLLEDERLISSRYAFAVKARLSDYSGSILPGTYILSSDMTMEQMLRRICGETGTNVDGQEGSAGSQPVTGELEDTLPSEEKENRDVWGQ